MRLPSEKFSITYIIHELLSHETTEFITPSEQKILKIVEELEKRKLNYLCEKTETYTKIKIIR